MRRNIVSWDGLKFNEGISEVRGLSEEDSTSSISKGRITLRRLSSKDVCAAGLGATSGRALDRMSMSRFHNF